MPQIKFHQFYIPLERNIKTSCQICREEFGVIKRQHICKRCLRSVCHECSSFKVKVYKSDMQNKLHRMCRTCHIQSEFLHKYVQNHHLKWGQDSDLVKMWLKKLGLKTTPKRRNSERRKMKEYVSFENLWKSLNFSFREFIGIVLDQVKTNQRQLSELINIGLSQIKCHKLQNIEDAAYILLFFLAHCNISNAIYFTLTILQIIEPEEFTLENIIYFLQMMNCSEIEIYKMENIIEEMSQKVLRRATVNVFTAQLTIQIMAFLLVKRQYEQLEKGIAFVFSQRKQFICSHNNQPQNVYLDLVRNLTAQQYRKMIKQMDKSQKSQTNSQSFDERKYERLTKQKQELFLKMKSQQQQIYRLKQENRLLQSQSVRQSPPVDDIDYSRCQIYETKNDPYSTQSGEESTYNQILYKKNEEIASLKKQLTKVKDNIKESEQQNMNTNEDDKTKILSKENELKGKDEELSKIKTQNEALKNMNKRLLLKMHELSNLLMDKEEKQVNESSKRLQEITSSLEDIGKEQINKQCIIF